MRTTTQLLLCSVLAGCAQVGEGGHYYGSVDGGAGSATRACDDLVSLPGDMTITGTWASPTCRPAAGSSAAS